jgi:hypothetical protein
MKRVAADCRREFGLADYPAGAILDALREICPDATKAEINAVLKSAEAELWAKMERLGEQCSDDFVGFTREIETWLELAKGRCHDLFEAQL